MPRNVWAVDYNTLKVMLEETRSKTSKKARIIQRSVDNIRRAIKILHKNSFHKKTKICLMYPNKQTHINIKRKWKVYVWANGVDGGYEGNRHTNQSLHTEFEFQLGYSISSSFRYVYLLSDASTDTAKKKKKKKVTILYRTFLIHQIRYYFQKWY